MNPGLLSGPFSLVGSHFFRALRSKLRAYRKVALSCSNSYWFHFPLARREAAGVFVKEATAYLHTISLIAAKSSKVFLALRKYRVNPMLNFLLNLVRNLFLILMILRIFLPTFLQYFYCETSNPRMRQNQAKL